MTGMRTHRVTLGEDLSSIAKCYYGDKASNTHALVIYQHNRDVLSTPSGVTPGMVLVIPHIEAGLLP